MAKDYPQWANKIMHAQFTVGNVAFSMSDMMRDKAVIGDQISLMLNCDSERQLKEHFSKLSEGGEVFMPVEKQFWGAWFGVVTDKYGMEWNLNCPIKE
jgi:PhnB protein